MLDVTQGPEQSYHSEHSEYYAMMRLEPESFEQVWDAATEELRAGKALVFSTRGFADPIEAQRAVDFLAGSTIALGGHVENVGDGIFLFTPSHAQVSVYGQDAARAPAPGMPSLFWFLGLGNGR